MSRILILFLSALALSAQDVRGRWKANRVLDYSQVSSTEATPTNLIGKYLTVKDQAVTFNKIKCDALLSTSLVNRNEVLVSEFRSTGKQTFSLPEKVKRVDLGCTSLLLQDKDHGVLNWEGAIVEGEKKSAR